MSPQPSSGSRASLRIPGSEAERWLLASPYGGDRRTSDRSRPFPTEPSRRSRRSLCCLRDAGRHRPYVSSRSTPATSEAGQELYDLEADPGEEINLAGEYPEAVAALRRDGQALVRDFSDTQGPAPETLELLRSLGYIQ